MGYPSQDLLEMGVFGCLFVGFLLLLGGARASGAALLGSSAGALFVALTPLRSGHLESLVHGAGLGASVGLVVFGLAGLALGAAEPLARHLKALALATVVLGVLVIRHVHALAAPTCSLNTGRKIASDAPFAVSCLRGFDPWAQRLLAFNFAFLALLFLVQAVIERTNDTNRSVASSG